MNILIWGIILLAICAGTIVVGIKYDIWIAPITSISLVFGIVFIVISIVSFVNHDRETTVKMEYIRPSNLKVEKYEEYVDITCKELEPQRYTKIKWFNVNTNRVWIEKDIRLNGDTHYRLVITNLER